MAAHTEEHGSKDHGGHGGADPMAWVEKNMGGIITPIGNATEAVLERLLVFMISGILQRLAIVYIALFTPLLLIEFLINSLR